MIRSQNKPTHQQAQGQVYLPYEKIFTADVADVDASDKVYFPLDPCFIYEVVAECLVTVDGAAPAVLVGDSGDDDAFIAAAATIETAGDVAKATASKHYTSPDHLEVTFNADATEGVIQLRVIFSGEE